MRALRNLLSPYRGLPREVYIIFFAKMINAAGCFVFPLLTMILTKKVGLPKDVAGLYVSIGGLLFIPSSMIGGKLADTMGRKGVIIVFDFLAVLLYATCGLIKPDLTMVYVFMAAAACMGVAGPAHDSLMADLTTPANRESAYALSYMGWNIGFAVGPMLGGLLFEKNLALVFIGDAATALIALLLVAFAVKETIHTTRAEITDESRKLERRETGSIFQVLGKRPVLLYFALIVFGYNFTYSQWSFMMPLQVSQNFPASDARTYGMLASFNGLVVMSCTPLVTRALQNVKSIRKIVYGGILYAVGFGVLGLIRALPLFFMSVFVFTLGEIVLSISVSPFIMNLTPASHRGRMSAVMPTLMGMGHILGPLVMGRVLSHISIETGWLVVGLLASVSTLFMYGLELYSAKQADEDDDAAELAVS